MPAWLVKASIQAVRYGEFLALSPLLTQGLAVS